jgi:uncharacterized delta-60 repeat protein
MTTNTAPTLDSTANPNLAAELEGAANPSGTSIGALVAGSISDPNGAVNAIAISGLDTSLGSWQYSTDSGTTWLTVQAGMINSATEEVALLLGPSALIRLLPFGDLSGSLAAAITFRAWDQSSGNQGDYAVISATGGATAYSNASDTVNLAVTGIDQAPTFAVPNGTGQLLLAIGDPNANARATGAVLQPDGKIVLAGYAWNAGDDDFALARLNADGSFDTGFNGSGKLLSAIGIGFDSGQAVALQADGKIITAGYTASGGHYEFALTRVNVDGTLDTSFNGTGKVQLLPFGLTYDVATGVSVQGDGKIVVAGFTSSGGGTEFALSRLNSDGTLDTTFNGNGELVVPFASATAYAQGMAIQSDGKILVVGYASPSNSLNSDIALARVNPDGTLDTTFNASGTLKVPNAVGNTFGITAAVAPDGKIVVAGSYNAGFAIDRLNADGTLDTSFHGTGQLALALGFGSATSVTFQPDGKIIIAGYSPNSSGLYDITLVRLDVDGTLDSGFNGNGIVTVPSGANSTDVALSVLVQPDGRIIASGVSTASGVADFLIARFNPDGSLDGTFNGTPSSSTLGGTIPYTENAAPAALDHSVSIYDPELFAAGSYNGASVTLARHNGASSDDLFAGVGNLSLSAGNAVLSGVTLGTYTDTGGTLVITFNGNATQAHVNETLSSVGYSNSAAAANGSVQIDWTFSDGNSGAQGPGGALTITGSTSVDITGVQIGLTITGTNGRDHLTGGAGSDTIDGGLARDTMSGGAGNDTYYVNTVRDLVIEQPNAGTDTVISRANFTLPANVENLTLAGVRNFSANGNELDNAIIADTGNNSIQGHGGADTLTGGAGADKFVYASASDSTPNAFDTITDFTHAEADKIDLRGFDANASTVGIQQFRFIGTEAFSDFPNASGLLRFDPATHMLQGNTNADPIAEFQILLVGVTGVGTGANQISAADIDV